VPNGAQNAGALRLIVNGTIDGAVNSVSVGTTS
jgi:hypothetical protein